MPDRMSGGSLGYTRPLDGLGPVRRFGYSINAGAEHAGSDLGVSAFSSSYNEGSRVHSAQTFGTRVRFFCRVSLQRVGPGWHTGVEQRQVGTVGVEWHPVDSIE